MKKLTMLFTLLLFGIINLNAQTYLGLKGGLVISHLSGGHLGIEYTDEGNYGGSIGVAAEFVLGDYFSLAPEIVFNRRGSDIYKGQTNFSMATRLDIYHFPYLDIPLLVKGSYDLDFMEIYAKTGPYLGFMMGGEASETGTGILNSDFKTLDVFFGETMREQEYTRFDIGWYLGLGTGFYLGPGKAIVGFHYDIGFLDVAQDQPQPYVYKNMGANRGLIFEAGYLFEF
jgi:hypothetical protein